MLFSMEYQSMFSSWNVSCFLQMWNIDTLTSKINCLTTKMVRINKYFFRINRLLQLFSFESKSDVGHCLVPCIFSYIPCQYIALDVSRMHLVALGFIHLCYSLCLALGCRNSSVVLCQVVSKLLVGRLGECGLLPQIGCQVAVGVGNGSVRRFSCNLKKKKKKRFLIPDWSKFFN